jgi:hypothetical protein
MLHHSGRDAKEDTKEVAKGDTKEDAEGAFGLADGDHGEVVHLHAVKAR